MICPAPPAYWLRRSTATFAMSPTSSRTAPACWPRSITTASKNDNRLSRRRLVRRVQSRRESQGHGMPCPYRTRSELILDPQLHDAAVVGAGDRRRTWSARRCCRPGWPKRVWLNRLNASTRSWMRCLPREVEVLEQRQVGAREAGAAHGVAARVADLTGVRRQRQALEAAGVEPLRRRCAARRRSDRRSRSGRLVSDWSATSTGSVTVEREAGLRLDDAVHLPAAERRAARARPASRGVGSSAPKLTTNAVARRRTARRPSRAPAPRRSTPRRRSSPAASAAARRRCSGPET